MNETQHVDVLIVGAGFAGICMAIKLKQQGKRSFVVLERAERVGGTWRDNSYPGAACDVPSFVYSYSFDQNPEWSRMFSPQEEILNYIENCVNKHGLQNSIKLKSSVNKAVFNEADGLWDVYTQQGDHYQAKALMGATGPLNKAQFPDLPGMDSFKGPKFHTSHWDHSFDYKGNTVAVVGTGASAIQVVPGIAADVKKLYLFQRTPAWVTPRPDRDVKEWEQKLFKALPFTQTIARTLVYWQLEIRALAFTRYPGILEQVGKLVLRHMYKSINDPELRKKLTPNYTMGCKRVLVSNDYYPALARPNVEVLTGGLRAVTETGVVNADGTEHDVDAIIFATGFQASDHNAPFEIRGLKNRDLREEWAPGGEAYLGTTVSGYPNMFMFVGPNTGLGHNSIIHIIESQANYVMQAINTLFDKKMKYLNVKEQEQEKYNQQIQKRLSRTVWNVGGCQSWYLNANGKNTTLWPGFTIGYRQATAKFDVSKYELIKA